ncbi:MAG: DUF4112 domain-containing protein [Niabella sp.]|nr:DUF4112 domain-containing protein [Niabella sp.]
MSQQPGAQNPDTRLKTVLRIAKLMDEQFAVGGFRFGLDPLLNLIPIVGDISGYFISIGLILTMMQYGASGKLVTKMIINASLDALVGAVPVLGWFFDFAYKANMKNVKLLTEHYTEGKHKGSAKSVILPVLLVTGIILVLLIFISVKFLLWFIAWGDKAIGVKM